MGWRERRIDGTYCSLVVLVLEIESVFPDVDTDEGNEGS